LDFQYCPDFKSFTHYIRPHEALEGATPADKAGIVVTGQDKWKTIIENAKGESA